MSTRPTTDNTKASLIAQLLGLGQTSSTETALFHQKAAKQLGAGITDMKALSVLMQEGPMTLAALGRRLSLTSGAVTNLVDRLENRGMVQRTADANDRRKTIVTVVEEAFSQERNPYVSMGESYAKLLDTYSVEQLTFLVEYLERQITLTQQEIANLTHIRN